MKKKVFVISSTLRNGGNSELLADSFAKGAADAGHAVERLNLRDIKLEFCKGCLVCQKEGAHDCIIKDGVEPLLPKIQESEVIVFATPIYFYAMAGQLKTFIDRLNPLFPREYNFKDVYLLASAADTGTHSMDGAQKEVQGWIDCCKDVELKGAVNALGVANIGDVNGTDYIAKAYELGKNV